MGPLPALCGGSACGEYHSATALCFSLILQEEEEDVTPEAPEPKDGVNGSEHDDEKAPSPGIANGKVDEMDIIVQSGSQRAIENLLRVYYEPLELWFFRMSIEKVRFTPNDIQYPVPADQIGTQARFPRDRLKTPRIVHTGRYILSPQAGCQSHPILRITLDPSIYADEIDRGH